MDMQGQFFQTHFAVVSIQFCLDAVVETSDDLPPRRFNYEATLLELAVSNRAYSKLPQVNIRSSFRTKQKTNRMFTHVGTFDEIFITQIVHVGEPPHKLANCNSRGKECEEKCGDLHRVSLSNNDGSFSIIFFIFERNSIWSGLPRAGRAAWRLGPQTEFLNSSFESSDWLVLVDVLVSSQRRSDAKWRVQTEAKQQHVLPSS